MPEPRLSVIIPTHNRKDLVQKTLASLAQVVAVPGEMEVLVVDDGSSDGTAEALAQARYPFALRVIRQAAPQGPAAARNHGAREARGEILGFVDSDVLVDPLWWQQAAPHFSDPQVAGVEGCTLAHGEHLPTPFTHVVSNRKGGNFLTCNIFYRREVFFHVRGFDERFCAPHTREDSDLAFSILETGQQIVFEEKSRVVHPFVSTPPNLYLKETRYGFHEALLRRKHPKTYVRLKWIDGRAVPVFYFGVYLGAVFILAGWLAGSTAAWIAGSAGWVLGTTGSIYAVCRHRQVTVKHLVWLVAQFMLVPWVRLFWVWRGEWHYRHIKPEAR